jgi:hypothetical protein
VGSAHPHSCYTSAMTPESMAFDQYRGDVHVCVKKRTGRTWYSVGSASCHTSNEYGVTIFENDVRKLEERNREYQFAVLAYEPRKAHPFTLVFE